MESAGLIYVSEVREKGRCWEKSGSAGSACHVLYASCYSISLLMNSVTKTQSPKQSIMGLEEFTPLAGSVTSKKVYLKRLKAERIL